MALESARKQHDKGQYKKVHIEDTDVSATTLFQLPA